MEKCPADVHTHLCDHFAPGLVPLAVIGSFLFLLQHSLPGGAVLKCKLTQNLTETVDAHLSYRIRWVAQEKQE